MTANNTVITIRDVILTRAKKVTQVSLIYTTRNQKLNSGGKEKLKSQNGTAYPLFEHIRNLT